MAEWSKAHAWKVCRRETVSWVRIPPSPPLLFFLDNELELKSSELFPPFNFTKGISTLRMKIDPRNTQVGQDGDTLEDCQTVLYDIENDPNQTRPINETVAEKQLIELVALEFARHDAPLELYKHFDLRKPDA